MVCLPLVIFSGSPAPVIIWNAPIIIIKTRIGAPITKSQLVMRLISSAKVLVGPSGFGSLIIWLPPLPLSPSRRKPAFGKLLSVLGVGPPVGGGVVGEGGGGAIKVVFGQVSVKLTLPSGQLVTPKTAIGIRKEKTKMTNKINLLFVICCLLFELCS